MSENLKKLVEELSLALKDSIHESEKIRGLLHRIEEGGYDATVTLAILLNLKNQNTEIQKTVYGPAKGRDRKVAGRRISAFDRRFLRALKIRLPD